MTNLYLQDFVQNLSYNNNYFYKDNKNYVLAQSWNLAVKNHSSQIYWSIKITGIKPAFGFL